MYNFNDKTFSLIQNTETGEVSSDTIFKYQQQGDLVTADYSGGTIVYGKIIALLQADRLQMVYQCLTTDQELKTGKAIAHISRTATGKILLDLDWQWLGDHTGSGTSQYLEN